MTTNLVSFICSYSCRYSFSSCNGSFAVQAETADEARKLARQYLSEHGGLEGIDYNIRKA